MTDIDRSGCQGTQHGTRTAYHNHGCRCPDAREAERVGNKRRREGRVPRTLVPSIGTARRLQSLVASGFRKVYLGHRLGISDQRLHQLIQPWRPYVTRATEARVKALFGELDGTDGGSKYARTVARRNGWVDLSAWDDVNDPSEQPKLGGPAVAVVDEVKVQRAAGGVQQTLTAVERRLAVDLLTGRGKSQREIAQILGISPRRVCSHRSQARRMRAA